MQFTNPIWLWSLTGMIVPIGIHLLSRKEGRTIWIGSIRYLKESPTAQFRHVRLNEIILLILRCALVILLALLLSGLQLDIKTERQKWVLIEKGIEKSQRFVPLLQRLQRSDYDLRFLSKGFPSFPDSASIDHDLNYRALAEDLQTRNIDSIMVVCYNFQKFFPGEKTDLPPNIKWLTEDPGQKLFTAQTIRLGKDSLWMRNGYTNATATYFETDIVSGNAKNDNEVKGRKNISVSIFSGNDFEYDRKIIMAALEALQTISPHEIQITNRPTKEWNNPQSEWIIWLSNEPPPWSRRNNSIIFRECEYQNLPLLTMNQNASLYCKASGAASWILTQRLNDENALREKLTLRLASVILPKDDDIRIIDNRVLPEQIVWAATNKKSPEVVKPEAAKNAGDPYIIFLLLGVLFAERWLAFKRKQ